MGSAVPEVKVINGYKKFMFSVKPAARLESPYTYDQ